MKEYKVRNREYLLSVALLTVTVLAIGTMLWSMDTGPARLGP